MLKKALDHLTATFDKAKAMRNAERHVAQGKLRAAISEYKTVVQNDPRDFGTMNMLGDLYLKNAENNKAIECYKAVAEHYQKQGFAQKAIAVYKKISKLAPNSVEISAKLAELYQNKGSLSEARGHYTTLADHYLQSGKTIEAQAIWKQVALLDPNDTEVCLKLAESFIQEEQLEEAADSYAEAALRFSRVARYDDASQNFQKALAISPNLFKALEGLVKLHEQCGTPNEAAEFLEALLGKEHFNQEALCLLIDCYLGSKQPIKAEQNLVRLVELDASRSPRFLDLAKAYIADGDVVSTVRVLSLCIERLLKAGRAADCKEWIDEILKREPQNLGGLRLKVRYCSWERQKKDLRSTLEELAGAAKKSESVEDERYALSQLVIIVPQETDYSDRLREINEKFGYDENPYDETVLSSEYDGQDPAEYFETVPVDIVPTNGNGKSQTKAAEDIIERNGVETGSADYDALDAQLLEDVETTALDKAPQNGADFMREGAVEKELESIRFYIENGYVDLARTALGDLRSSYGDHPDFAEIESSIQSLPAEDVVAEQEIEVEAVDAVGGNSFSDMRSELGFDDAEQVDESDDYDTHYQLAVAYHEMGLMEDAIKEFQDAINLVRPDDSKQRFFQCANLLGHCFMQNSMGKLALKWFERALETPNLGGDEKKALWYEIAMAYEADGDTENSARYFEQVYAEDVDFRDIGERMKNVLVAG